MGNQVFIFLTFVGLICAQSSAQDCVPLRCTRPLDIGTCNAIITQYYFDATAKQCKTFNYTGCGGNVNRFRTLELCQRTCSKTAPNCGNNTGSLPPRCSLEMDSGPCRGYHPRFYFDTVSGTCKGFVYGGCQGNNNNFPSQEHCENTCVNI